MTYPRKHSKQKTLLVRELSNKDNEIDRLLKIIDKLEDKITELKNDKIKLQSFICKTSNIIEEKLKERYSLF